MHVLFVVYGVEAASAAYSSRCQIKIFCALINIKSNEIPSRFIRTPLRGSEELLLNEAPAYVSMYMPSHNNSVYNTIKQMSSIFPNFVIVSYGEKSAREE